MKSMTRPIGQLTLAACMALLSSNTLAEDAGMQWTNESFEVEKITLYPKKWKGVDATWVDVAVKNVGQQPTRFRVIVKLDDEPGFAATTKTEVPVGGEATVVLSTTAGTIPREVDVRVQALP